MSDRDSAGPGYHGPMGEGYHRFSARTHRSPMDHGMDGSAESGLHILPPGLWWRSGPLAQRLSLSPEQTKRMDDIFQRSRLQLIDLHANVERQNVILEPMLSANPIDQAKTLVQIDKVADARAALEKADAKMLLALRGVLTPEQWTKLHSRSDRGPGMHGSGAPGSSQENPGGPRGQGGPQGSAGPQGSGRSPRGAPAPGGPSNLVEPRPEF